jgi:hypothetical protein
MYGKLLKGFSAVLISADRSRLLNQPVTPLAPDSRNTDLPVLPKQSKAIPKPD